MKTPRAIILIKTIGAFLTGFLILCNSVLAQRIALTFDDAPLKDGNLYKGLKRSEILIKKLKEYNVPEVAFFANSSKLNAEGTLRLKMYAKAGHLIGNHTHTHGHIDEMGVDNYIEDIKIADSLLKKLPGFTPWFRYPFLDEGKEERIRNNLRYALRTLGYTNGYVTVDNYNWYLNKLYQDALKKNEKIHYGLLRDLYIEHIWKSIQFYDKIARKTLGRSPQHVLLLHENDLAALFLDDLILHLRGHGWEIVSPTEAYQDPIANHLPDVLMNNQGRVAAIAKENGFAGKDLVQESEDEDFLKAYFYKKKVFR